MLFNSRVLLFVTLNPLEHWVEYLTTTCSTLSEQPSLSTPQETELTNKK